MNTEKICVVFISNKKYLEKFIKTCNQLINAGNYNGDICLIIGDDLIEHKFEEKIFKNIFVKHFNNLNFGEEWSNINNEIKSYFRRGVFEKKFQFHKFYLFHTFLKKWNYILYIDCGMNIYNDINPILNERKENTLLANRDGHDFETIYGGLTLRDQFINLYSNEKQKKYIDLLNNNYNLDILTFQTGLMLYDTNIISNNTFNDLIDLNIKYPISKTNEQGIIGLYFIYINETKWKQIKRKNNEIYFYDSTRFINKKYIMVKWESKLYMKIGYLQN